MNTLRPLLIAIQFLTRLPVRMSKPPNPCEVGLSVLYYPLVGLMIGGILVLLASQLARDTHFLNAVLLLCAWVGLTGAFHLDGLADSADAWAGGLGNPERTLAIMKDPRCGPIGVVAVVLVLLVKAATLDLIVSQRDWISLALTPLLGRSTVVLLFITTPYVRHNGLGSGQAQFVPIPSAVMVLIAIAIITMLTVGWQGAAILLFVTCGCLYLRYLMMVRINGMTGDTAGATIELTECIVLVAASMLAH